jgi:para-aminobenzoate N-oxygenase AurF
VTLDLSTMPDIPIFDAWDERAWVRRGSPAVAESNGEHFFPTELVPHLAHPAVSAAAPEQRRYLAAQHLYQWLRFTVNFEVSVVNRATLSIANGTSGVTVPENASVTAYKIYTDEGFHSLESLRVLRHVEKSSGIRALPYDFERFLRRLDAVGSDRPEHLKLIRLLQVVVFETLITAIFADIPTDQRVLPIVRQMVADHAADERCHHAYFAAFFRELWAGMDRPMRVLTGRLLPGLITESLQPATRPALDALTTCGFADDQARDIVADAYNPDAVRNGIRFAARKTIALFEDCGVLDDPAARDAFAAAGLSPGAR